MLKELQDIGLSEKEARVYLSALEIGKATADHLAKQAKIVRSTTYVQLESLMEKGLMSTYQEGKKTYFAPESPELLKRLLAKQREVIGSKERDLTSVLPDLIRQFEGAGERPVVRFFPGKEGIDVVREEMLKTKDKKTYVLFSPEHMSNLYSDQYLNEYTKRRKALNIHSKGIYVNKEYFERADLDELTERRFLPPTILKPLTIDFYIFDNKVGIISLEGSIFGLVIESAGIAQSMKSLFDFLWQHSQDHK